MTSLLRNLALLSLLAFAAPSWSLGDALDDPLAKPAAPSGYWGLGFDWMNFSMNRGGVLNTFPSLSQGANLQSSSANLHGFVGFRLDEILSVQCDLIGMGSVRVTDLGVTRKLFDPILFSVSAVMTQPLSNNLKAYGKLGGSYWSLSQPLTSTQALNLNSGFGLSFGAGLDINLYGGTDRVLRLEWNHYKMDGVLIDKADGLTLGANFSF